MKAKLLVVLFAGTILLSTTYVNAKIFGTCTKINPRTGEGSFSFNAGGIPAEIGRKNGRTYGSIGPFKASKSRGPQLLGSTVLNDPANADALGDAQIDFMGKTILGSKK